MNRVVTMGEMMLRLLPPGNTRIEQTSVFNCNYGGDESIVAVSLARFGIPSAYITKLPDNPLGRAAFNSVRAQGVDTRHIVLGGGRLGLNFYETGASVRASRVLYDRKHSAIAESHPDEFDFESAFDGAEWFHVSGITPALSQNCEKITERALATAKKMGLTVSIDLNYRRKLWSPEKAQSVMKRLMGYVDVCIGNEEDAELSLGLKAGQTDVFKGDLDQEGYQELLARLYQEYDLRMAATTLRKSLSASDNGWSVMIYDGQEYSCSREYSIHLVDRGGGGAAFSAALIYGVLSKLPLDDIAEFAGAASALKQTIQGDYNLVSLEEVYELVKGDLSGRVQR